MPILGPFKNSKEKRDRLAAKQRLRTAANPERTSAISRKSYEIHRAKQLADTRVREVQRKTEVLTHYGPNGILNCSYPDCSVTDIDCLTLDHLDNTGAEDRRSGKLKSGVHGYRKLIQDGFPFGFQTLCWNHQAKKELVRRRENRT